MARRIALTELNGDTADILNTIRANASAEYQSLVPVVTQAEDLPRVGEAIYGYPALANQFVSLLNRIAAVKIKSATFNNPYADLKKGFLGFGATVEESFVQMAKAREFSAEKAAARELKRTLPNVKSAFHTINWRVQYPVTIQNDELRQAFLSWEGVEDLIAKIVDSVYRAAEYDEYLLFKYLIIKGVTGGKMKPVTVDTSDPDNAAVAFRAASNTLRFVSSDYNAAGVHTNTPVEDQFIFMDSNFNAQYDVKVLAAAFNMDKADFMGRLKLIDSFTSFDNERFAEIRAESTGLDEVTPEELALMANVKAVLVDGEYFQLYDTLSQFTETYVSSGLYWNYNYNVWKIVSASPFSNAVVFVDETANTLLPSSLTLEVTGKTTCEASTILTLTVTGSPDEPSFTVPGMAIFRQTKEATQEGIAVHPYGALIFPANASGMSPVVSFGDVDYAVASGASGSWTGDAVKSTADVGDVFTLYPNTNAAITGTFPEY